MALRWLRTICANQMRTLAAPTRWNLRKPEIGSAGAGRRVLWFSCGRSQSAPRHGCQWKRCNSVETSMETTDRQPQHFSTGRPPRFAHRGCEPVVRTTGANWSSTGARVRTSSAYLAAYLGRITHSDCVTIVREALRVIGPVLPARTAHSVDTSLDTGRSVPRQRPG